MKKEFIFILLLLCLLISCKSKSVYDIKVIDFSDDTSSENLEIESNELKSEMFIDEKEQKQQIVTTNIGDIEASYCCTYKIKYQYFYEKEFIDKNNNIFRINEGGIVTCYLWINSKELKDEIIEDDAKIIANNFFENFNTVVNLNDYELTTTYDEENELFLFNYKKYINGIETLDTAELKIDKFGNLDSFNSSFFGKISYSNDVNYNTEVINKEIKNKLDNILKDIKKMYDEVNYNLDNYRIIMLSEDEYALINTVEIKFIKKYNNDYSLLESKIVFLVK